MVVRLALAALLSGCVFGAGAFAGYGKHGFTAGAEASAGVGPFQATAGFDRFRHTYGRADIAYDMAYKSQPGVYRAGRVGLGYLYGDQVPDHFTGVAGAGVV